MFDFHTADNAPQPHVKVVSGERTICIIPIENGDVSEAEAFAEIFIEALTSQ